MGEALPSVKPLATGLERFRVKVFVSTGNDGVVLCSPSS